VISMPGGPSLGGTRVCGTGKRGVQAGTTIDYLRGRTDCHAPSLLGSATERLSERATKLVNRVKESMTWRNNQIR
jgi:hypothetical protein